MQQAYKLSNKEEIKKYALSVKKEEDEKDKTQKYFL
jgi:hypothetical protein